jgi:ABC-2 type transport system ATP-binding protein
VALIIETTKLGKRYREVTAVDDLSIQVAEGELYAFLGLNGAGKTTTLRMLLGMVRPTAGRANVCGVRVGSGRREPWASVGYLLDTPRAYPELTVRENLEVARRLHPGTPPQAIGRSIEQFRLAPYADRRAGTLSLGNAQRLGLAKALLHAPRLLLLDEPANGLDPAGIVEIRTLLLELTRTEGVTVFMSSHILAEVARLAQRIGIIHGGRLLREMDMETLERDRQRRLLVKVREPEAAFRVLCASGHATQILADGSLELRHPLVVSAPEKIATLLVESGAPPVQLVVEEEELEHYFLRLIGARGGEE